jgi:hypothetical protein
LSAPAPQVRVDPSPSSVIRLRQGPDRTQLRAASPLYSPSSCRRWPPMPLDSTNPVSPTPSRLTAMGPQQTFERHRWQLRLRQSIGSEVLPESDREDDYASHSGQPSPDGSLEVCKCEDSVGLLSPPSSQPSRRASLLGSCNGSATFLMWIIGAFCSRSRSRNKSSGSGSGSSAVGARDTTPMSQYLAHQWHLNVPAHTA